MKTMTAATATADPALSAVPESLGDLSGPAAGKITLPVSICWWLPDLTFDISDPDDIRDAYEAVLGHGSRFDAARYLNEQRLRQLWPHLRFDISRRLAWERQHPELRQAAAA